MSGLPSHGHGADLTPESRPTHHDDVRHGEEHQHCEGSEVQRARRLVSAEEVEQHRGGGGDSGRHRQARQDQERRHQKDHDDVAGALQRPVVWTARRHRHEAAQMLPQVSPQGRDRERLAPAEEMTTEVSGNGSRQHVGEARGHQHPRRQEVQASPPAVLIEDLERAPGRHRRAGTIEERCWRGPAAVPMVAADRQLQERRRQVVARFAPVEARMHHQDLDAAERQRRHGGGRNPVRQPHPTRVHGRGTDGHASERATTA